MIFLDREEAGNRLAAQLVEAGIPDPIVIALPRGGVPVGREVALALGAPLDVRVTRKIGAPGMPEYGIGAVVEDGTLWIDKRAVEDLEIPDLELQERVNHERLNAHEQVERFRRGTPRTPVTGRNVILVDDGLATGGTAHAALRSLRGEGARSVTLAVPVAAPESVRKLERETDRIICLSQPEGFMSVGAWYQDFGQVSDEDVIRILDELSPAGRGGAMEEIEISDGIVRLPGTLTIPRDASGLVVFAHGSGSSRHSPRNIEVARTLQRAGLATLLLDLLDVEEAMERDNVFDIPLLASRLILAHSVLRQKPETAHLPIGFFGASTGGGAALWAAAILKEEILAVVSRGGRPDLASEKLAQVSAPTLLIVGGNDPEVLDLNRLAHDELPHSKLTVVTGATHLFEEPGALETVAHAARDWFKHHLVAVRRKAA